MSKLLFTRALPIARYIILLEVVSRARCLGKNRPTDGRMVKKLNDLGSIQSLFSSGHLFCLL